MFSPSRLQLKPGDKAKVSTRVHEFLKATMIGTSVDDSLDLSCLLEEDCPAVMHTLRDELQRKIAKDPGRFKQLFRFEDPDLSSYISALDISGDVSTDGAGPLRGSGRLRQRRERAAHVFRCKTSDLVTWQVEQAVDADGSTVLGSELQDMMRLHNASSVSWDSVEAKVHVGRAPQQMHVVGVMERGAALPLHGGALGGLFKDCEEEVGVQCRSCVSDALQQLCFHPQLRGAQLLISHVRDETFGRHSVRLQWAPVLAEGAQAAAAQADSGVSAAEKYEMWERRLIDFFLTHGVVGRDGGMDSWQPSAITPEFAYPNGEYYTLHWETVLKKHEFFKDQVPDGARQHRQ